MARGNITKALLTYKHIFIIAMVSIILLIYFIPFSYSIASSSGGGDDSYGHFRNTPPPGHGGPPANGNPPGDGGTSHIPPGLQNNPSGHVGEQGGGQGFSNGGGQGFSNGGGQGFSNGGGQGFSNGGGRH
jgi:hypothetical protein